MKESVRFPATDGRFTVQRKHVGRGTILLCCLFFFTLLNAQTTRSTVARQQRPLSLEEITARISALQQKIDSLTSVYNALRQDSSRLKQDAAQQTSALARQQAELDDLIARKKTLAGSIRSQYEKAMQDSIQILASSREQMAALHKDIVKLESSIITMSNELEVLSSRRDQLDRPAATTEAKTIERLQAQIARNDSLIRVRQATFAELTAQRDKLRQDSVQMSGRLTAGRLEFHDQIEAMDKSIAQCNAALEAIIQKQAALRGEKEKKLADLKATQSNLATQKRGLADQITRLEAEIASLTAEKQRLLQSAGSAQKKHELVRKPYLQSLEDAESALARAVEERNLTKALREKLRLDSAISKLRDDLDEAIKAEAERKRGAKKLVEQRESELNDKLNALDALIQNSPGIRQKEASVRAPTVAQKTGLVIDALTASEKIVAQATAARDKAKQALADFDAKNPPPPDPSSGRMNAIDSATNVKKRAIIQMTEQIDSISLVSAELQTTLGNVSQNISRETGKGDSLVNAKRAEKAALVAKRAAIVKDSIAHELEIAKVFPKLKTDLAAIGNKLILLQNEISTLTTERDNAKQALKASQEKANQTAVSQKMERQKLDSLIAAKQQEITLVSMKSEKLRQDSITLAKREAQQIKSLNPPPSSFGTRLVAAETEIAGLQAQSDSLKRAIGIIEAKPGEQAKKISLQIAAVVRAIDAAKHDLASMEKEKLAAFERLKNDRGKFDSLIAVLEQDVAAAILKRDKARQDSVTAEANLRQASQKMQDDIRTLDNMVAGRQREVTIAAEDVDRAREDSVKIAEKIPEVLQTFSQSVKSIDVLIAAKEKELADLKAKRDKARQDSIAEYKKQLDLLAKAHDEIIKRNAVVAQKKADAAQAAAERKKAQTDTASYKLKAKQELALATAEIDRQNAVIERKKAELARMQKQRAEIAGYFKTAGGGSGTMAVVEPKPAAPTPTFSPASATPATTSEVLAPTPKEIAQLRSEELYTMLGENKVAETAKRFRQLQGFLKANLDPEAFATLKLTIEQMGGSVQ